MADEPAPPPISPLPRHRNDANDGQRPEHFRQIVEVAPNALIMVDRAGLIDLVNVEAERVFGYPREEMLGRPIEMLVPERFRHHHPGLRDTFFADLSSRPMGAGRDLYCLRRDRSEFPVEIGLKPIEDEDGGWKVLSTIFDISDRKQREAHLQSALREKEVLLSEVHHRVKNNLQVVYSLLDLQSAQFSDSAVQDIMREAKNRVRSMVEIHQILYQSKDFAAVDCRQFLDALVPSLVGSYGVDNARITVAVDADHVRLPLDSAIPCGLVLNELISNALKHAFPQGRAGRIGVSLLQDEERAVMLAVSDDGVGLPETLDIATAPTLGLQLVGLLADQLGGTLAVNRADPTCFTVRFAVGDAVAVVAGGE